MEKGIILANKLNYIQAHLNFKKHYNNQKPDKISQKRTETLSGITLSQKDRKNIEY